MRTIYVEISYDGRYYRLPGHLDWMCVNERTLAKLRVDLLNEYEDKRQEYLEECRHEGLNIKTKPIQNICFTYHMPNNVIF